MQISLLNLISTPIAVLNSLKLDLQVGLSSDDPMVGRYPSEPYDAYLSVYSPEGSLLDRSHLGNIPPNRRKFFDLTAITRRFVSGTDHLVVVHRVPSRLIPGDASDTASLEPEIELRQPRDYSFFRSLVQYSYPQGGNGAVVYETPPGLNSKGLNSKGSGPRSVSTLTFTCQMVLSEHTNTNIAVIHHSVDASYSHVADYNYGLYSLGGELVASGGISIGPFSVGVLNIGELVPRQRVQEDMDPIDRRSAYTFVGCCDDAIVLPVVVNVAPELGAVAVEHTHPPQSYLMPQDFGLKYRVKSEATKAWSNIFSGAAKK